MAYRSKFTGAEVDSLLEQVQKGEAGGSVTVDSSLSTTSENPVMNKAITEELNKKLEGEVVGTTSPTEGTVGGSYDDTEIKKDIADLQAKDKATDAQLATLQQKDTQTEAKLAELSADIGKVSDKTDNLHSATFNPFTRLGEAFAEGIAVPKFVANANADSTDYLPVPPRIVGRMYLSNSNPNYKISFLTTEKKFISNYAAPSTGVQDVNFMPPSNAAYMVITTYKAYTDQGYLMRQLYPTFVAQEAIKEDVAALKADTENLGTMQKTTYDMAANTRLSKGLPCNTGKVVLRLDMIEGSNSNSININRYTNNAYNAERLITGAELGKSYVLDIPEGDDGIWIFLEAGASAYKLVCTIENKLYERVSSVEGKVEELQANQSWKGRTIVCFGDSLTEFKDIDNEKAYADYIHDITGAEVYNIGIGGSQYRQRMTPVATPTTSSEAYAALDMINMVKACCEQEFSKQIAATNYLTAANLDRNDEIIARMQTIDWSKVDIVTFYGGGNDWNNASESWGEPTLENADINTTYGAINEIVRILLTAYPHLRIYWFSPSVSWQTDSSGQRTDATWSDNLKKNGTTKGEFSDIVMGVVKRHHIPICDMYNTLGWNKLNFSQFFTDTDGSHPRKGEGTLQTAKKIISFINANRTF